MCNSEIAIEQQNITRDIYKSILNYLKETNKILNDYENNLKKLCQ